MSPIANQFKVKYEMRRKLEVIPSLHPSLSVEWDQTASHNIDQRLNVDSVFSRLEARRERWRRGSGLCTQPVKPNKRTMVEVARGWLGNPNMLHYY